MGKVNTGFINVPINAKIIDFNDKEGAVKYYTSMMLNRTQSMFVYENLPSTIPQEMLELYLQVNGYACIGKDNNGDLYAFFGGYGGKLDGYYRPTQVIVANPYLNVDKTFNIDKDCVVIPNDTFYMGLMPMFNRYATLLAENDISIRLADIQARIMTFISCKDDNTFNSAKKFLEDIEKGMIGVVSDNAFLDSIKAENYGGGSNGLITQLIELQQYLKASWFNDLGLNANYNMKRESINSSEAQMNDDALLPLVDNMLYCRETYIKKVNEMFGTNIKVRLNSSWEYKEVELENAMKETENATEDNTDVKEQDNNDDTGVL